MKCQGCGHDYPSALPRCTRCGQLTPRQTRRTSQSRLIEFPRPARPVPEKSAIPATAPAWRAELSEKVRQIRAKRNGDEPGDLTPLPADPRPPRPKPQDAVKAVVDRAKVANNNHLVEAALNRVKRAGNGSSDSALPSAKHRAMTQSQPVYAGKGREATARALAATPEPILFSEPSEPVQAKAPIKLDAVTTVVSSAAATRTRQSGPLYTTTTISERTTSGGSATASRPATTTPLTPRNEAQYETRYEPKYEATKFDDDLDPVADIVALDEIEPLDYLEAEVKKVDRALAQDRSPYQAAPLVCRAISGAVDLGVVALSTAPFLLLMKLSHSSFGAFNTRISAAATFFLISLFYLCITHCLASKTFGMMVTNTRVVDSHRFSPLSPSKAILRALGVFIAMAPVGIGFVWTAFDQKNRGLQDLIAGTVVVRDF